eukprot:315756_1
MRNIQTLLKNVLQKSEITKGELFTMTKLAGKDAQKIKPLQAFTNNIEMHGRGIECLKHYLPISTALKNDICLLQENIQLYNENKLSFDAVYCPKQQIEINAYSISALKHHINDYDIEYLQVSNSDDDIQCEDEKELSSIVILLEKYAYTFEGKNIQIHSDNTSVIKMLNKYKAKSSKPHLQCKITNIASLCMKYKINPYWSKIDAVGIASIVSDASCQSQ